MYGASLPLLSTDILPRAATLACPISITLACVVAEDPDSFGHQQASAPFTHKNQISNISTIALDGRNAVDLCVNDSYHLNVGALFISQLKAHVGTPPLSFRDVVTTFGRAQDVTLQAVELCSTEWDPEEEEYGLCDLRLIDLDANTVVAILGYISSVELLFIGRCSLRGQPLAVAHSYVPTIILEEIGDDLAPFLSDWHGKVLVIRNCSGFGDHVLGVLEGAIDKHKWFPFRSMTLGIHDSPSFSVAALKHLVESTLTGRGVPRVQFEIGITGKCPTLSPEDRTWFEANLVSFHWG